LISLWAFVVGEEDAMLGKSFDDGPQWNDGVTDRQEMINVLLS